MRIWIYFTDKPIGLRENGVVPRALARRRFAGFKPDDTAERPVSQNYIRAVEQFGGRLRNCYKWENAASFDVPAGSLTALSTLPFIKEVTLVGTSRQLTTPIIAPLGKRKTAGSDFYGESFDQLSLLNVPLAHDYLKRRYPEAAPASGVRIAFFDSGFRLRHRSFRHLFERGAILSAYDFVDRDAVVEDPDSVFTDYEHPYNRNDEHGSLVLSLVAAYDPPYFVGAAWGAQFLLARTEDSYKYEPPDMEPSREVHAEEDNWAAAVVWAESLGVDIISSSVAYRSDFDDSVIIDRGGGRFDTVVGYARTDLDGKTTIISRAAAGAVARGIIIVNSAGNEGSEGDISIDAPSDVDGVIAVGMTTTYGFIDRRGSRGPSADGRLKPDLVAPGSGVSMPNIYKYNSFDSYISDAGSSFAAPQIAGICALIKQAAPSLGAAQIRESLYRFCRPPANRPLPPVNQYGRGIPDALLSCMKRDEAYLTALDTTGLPLTGAIVATAYGDTLARFDSSGTAIVTTAAAEVVIMRGVDRRMIRFDSTPCRKILVPCSLLVRVLNDKRHVVPVAALKGRYGTVEIAERTDSLGHFKIVNFFQPTLHFVVSKEGYFPSDTIDLTLTDKYQEHVVILKPSTEIAATVFPTVIRRGSTDRFHIRCTVPLSETASPVLSAEIRSINGVLIWSVNRPIAPPLADIEWDCRSSTGAAISPGTYFVQLRFDGKKQRKKILIVP